MMNEKVSCELTENQIKALLLLMKRQSSLDCALKPLYDTLLEYLYNTMTIEEAEQFFDEN